MNGALEAIDVTKVKAKAGCLDSCSLLFVHNGDVVEFRHDYFRGREHKSEYVIINPEAEEYQQPEAKGWLSVVVDKLAERHR